MVILPPVAVRRAGADGAVVAEHLIKDVRA
jgi:hypothetical protein